MGGGVARSPTDLSSWSLSGVPKGLLVISCFCRGDPLLWRLFPSCGPALFRFGGLGASVHCRTLGFGSDRLWWRRLVLVGGLLVGDGGWRFVWVAVCLFEEGVFDGGLGWWCFSLGLGFCFAGFSGYRCWWWLRFWGVSWAGWQQDSWWMMEVIGAKVLWFWWQLFQRQGCFHGGEVSIQWRLRWHYGSDGSTSGADGACANLG